jgi:hypothetical protein
LPTPELTPTLDLQRFEISLVRTTPANHDITAKVHLDGEEKRSVSRVLRARERATKMLGRRVGVTEIRLFQFNAIVSGTGSVWMTSPTVSDWS